MLAGTGSPLDIRWQALATEAVTFLLTVLVLRRFAWRKIQGVLESRREAIRRQTEDLKARREEAERLKEEYREVLEMAGGEARTILQLAVARGDQIAKEISEKARSEAVALHRRVEKQIEEELAGAEAGLRESLIGMATTAAEKALMVELDPEMQERLMSAVVRELSEMEG